MQHRHQQVVVETARHRITGTVTLARDGYRSRISDVLNATEKEFLSLTDVTVVPLDGGPVEHHAFMALNRHQIVFALLDGGDEPSPAPPG